jgi:hypothetical protein
MDAGDAVEFFRKQGIKGTHVEIETVCAAYGFHPLTLRLLAGALKQDPRYRADINNAPRVEMREADKDKRMQRMLDFAYNSLPPCLSRHRRRASSRGVRAPSLCSGITQ